MLEDWNPSFTEPNPTESTLVHGLKNMCIPLVDPKRPTILEEYL